MKPTNLLYLENFRQTEDDAKVVEVIQEENRIVVYLDGTIFYPQGGGQPYDKGIMEGANGKFNVEEVRFVEGIVKHIGTFESGQFEKGETVKCLVDKERRELNSKLHSAGHLVDMAVQKLNLGWVPGKGFHFPDGPYVLYTGNVEESRREALKTQIEDECNKFIAQAVEVSAKFVDKDELAQICKNVPEHIPKGKPVRVIMFGDFGVPCGGTHVANLKDLKHVTIRKFKNEGPNVKISYDVDR